MNIFIFNQPKRTMLNMLFILSIISLFVNILAIATVVLWRYNSDIVSKIDKTIPNFYENNIKSLRKNARESKPVELKYNYYNKLYEELKDISTIHHHYFYRQESANFLIDYYIKNDKIKKAMEIVTKWEKDYPYDFQGKFKYIDVLSLVDSNKSLIYYKNLNNKHNDIIEVRDGYKSFLKEHK